MALRTISKRSSIRAPRFFAASSPIIGGRLSSLNLIRALRLASISSNKVSRSSSRSRSNRSMPKRRYRDRHAKGAIGVDLLIVAGFVAVAAADAGGIGQALAMAT
jgi:hypothetical protein